MHLGHKLGINELLLEWIKCFLSEITQRVIINDGEISSFSKESSGVPRGVCWAHFYF